MPWERIAWRSKWKAARAAVSSDAAPHGTLFPPLWTVCHLSAWKIPVTRNARIKSVIQACQIRCHEGQSFSDYTCWFHWEEEDMRRERGGSHLSNHLGSENVQKNSLSELFCITVHSEQIQLRGDLEKFLEGLWADVGTLKTHKPPRYDLSLLFRFRSWICASLLRYL